MVVRAPVVAGTDPDERHWGSDYDAWRPGSRYHTASSCEGDGREEQVQDSVSHGDTPFPSPLTFRRKFRAT